MYYLNHFHVGTIYNPMLNISLSEISEISSNLRFYDSSVNLNSNEFSQRNQKCFESLNDLMDLSDEHPFVLNHFVVELLNLTLVRNHSNVRNQAYTLILRSLKANPK
jgi:hypothetical protein